MRLIHATDGERTTLATDVDLADGFVSQTRGLMFRRSLPDGYGLAFPFDATKSRTIHMLFVFVPLDVVWLDGNVVQQVERLNPWFGIARARGDLIVELPAGAAADVEPGDEVLLEDG